MKRISALLAAFLITSPSAWAIRHTACGSSQTQVIDAQVHCVDQGGVSIGESAEGDSKFACLESKTVQNRCGPDGSLTRLRAFQGWLKQVKSFESTCASGGGTFSYADPYFVEPSNESYCQQAVPEVSSNMFEDTVCNFQSTCPGVKVTCQYSCSETPVASAF